MKHWKLIPEVLESVTALCESLNPKLVLDIGGGDRGVRFGPAHHTVGWEGDIKLDLSCDRLPFEDGSVNFVYCRHTIEDLAQPKHLLSEIKRIALNGYIETPSPMAELTRGVDAYGTHLGYLHHRWVCWTEQERLMVLAKYPIIERLPVPDSWERLSEPHNWNTYHVFRGGLEFEVLEHGAGFDLAKYDERDLPVEYLQLLERAVKR